MSERRYFGTDGIRGRVGVAPLTPDFLVRLGFAAGKALAAGRASGEVLIGKDTRRSGYMVESALEAGLSAAGADVLLSGPLPTSAVSYLTPALRLSAGIVISASHNPHHDNGVKFFGAAGGKLPLADEAKIEALLRGDSAIAFDGEPGRARRLDAAAERYIEFCKRAFPPFMDLRGLRLVVDCANGAAYHVAPAVFHELGADVVAVGDKPDGVNINVGCGTLSPELAQQTAKQEGADAAIVLDGDADRLLLIDETGRLRDGDALLYLMARRAVRRGEPPPGVVGTVLSNLSLERQLAGMNIQFCRAAVGDRYVNEALSARGWRMGGEPSGHIILRDFHHTGDGIIAALQALRAMREEDAPLSSLFGDYAPLPQETRNIRISNHRTALERPAAAAALAAARAELGDGARLIARPSGTEEVVRIMAEGEDRDKLHTALNHIEHCLRLKAE